LIDNGNGTWNIVMDSNRSVTATFTQIEHSLTITQATGGTITAFPAGPYHLNDPVTLTATPTVGYTFGGWTGDCAGQFNPCRLTMDGNKVVSAIFTWHYTLRESFDGPISNWTIKGSPKGYSAVVDTENYKEGTGSIKLTNPRNGYVQITQNTDWTLTAEEQGYFQFWVYVDGTSGPTTGTSIILSNDRSFKNYFIVDYGGDFNFNLKPGWNLITLDPTDWKTGKGSPTWTSPILCIRITIYGSAPTSYSFDQLISGSGLIP
jgi:uncharacterized repeat protein (TIGR02543 family)